jgi:hypothetical protein
VQIPEAFKAIKVKDRCRASCTRNGPLLPIESGWLEFDGATCAARPRSIVALFARY